MSEELLDVRQTMAVAMPSPPLPRTLSRRDIACVFFRHCWKAAAFSAAVLALAGLAIVRTEATYSSEAHLLIRPGRENLDIDPTAMLGERSMFVSKRWESEIGTELAILRSEDLAAEVVDAVGVVAFLGPTNAAAAPPGGGGLTTRLKAWVPRRLLSWLRAMRAPDQPLLVKVPTSPSQEVKAAAVSRLLRQLEVRVIEGSNVIVVKYTAGSARVVHTILTSLLGLYLKKHTSAYSTPAAQVFFADQAKAMRERLERMDTELRDLKNRAGIVDSYEHGRLVQARIDTLQNRIDDLGTELAASRARVADLAAQAAVTNKSTLILPAGTVSESRNTASAIQAEVMRQSTLEAERTSLADRMIVARRELSEQNAWETELMLMQRERELLQSKYQKYALVREQARMGDELERLHINTISTIQAPALAGVADPSGNALKALAAALVALIGSVGIVLLSESLDHSVRSPQEVEAALHLPVLASIPKLRAFRASVTAWVRCDRRRLCGPRGAAADSARHFERLGERIVASTWDPVRRPVVLGVTSGAYGEGSSTVASHLGVALARAEGNPRILLVAASSARGNGRHGHGICGTSGAADIRTDKEGRVVVLERNVYTLDGRQEADADAVPAAASWWLDHPELLDHLRSHDADFVIVDMPPWNDGSAALRLSRRMDNLILVVEAERASRHAVARCVQDMRNVAGDRILGVVLNKRRFHVPGWLYHRI